MLKIKQKSFKKHHCGLLIPFDSKITAVNWLITKFAYTNNILTDKENLQLSGSWSAFEMFKLNGKEWMVFSWIDIKKAPLRTLFGPIVGQLLIWVSWVGSLPFTNSKWSLTWCTAWCKVTEKIIKIGQSYKDWNPLRSPLLQFSTIS